MGQLWKRYTCPKCKKVYIDEPPIPEGKDCPECKIPFIIDDWEAVKQIEIDND